MALRQLPRITQYRGHVQTSAPAAEPVTAAELRTFLRETATGLPDAEADDFIAQARQEIEDFSGIAMIDQSWRLSLDRWPTQNEPWWDGVREGSISELHGARYASEVRLPRYPLSSVDSVTVYDEDSNSTAVTIGNVFDVDTAQHPGRITLQVGAVWPVALRANNAIEIVYTAGYGAGASDVPAPLVRAVKQLAAYFYSHRGDACDAESALKVSGAAGVLNTYRVARI